MAILVGMLLKTLVAGAIQRELKRTGHQQHPAITNLGLITTKLL